MVINVTFAVSRVNFIAMPSSAMINRIVSRMSDNLKVFGKCPLIFLDFSLIFCYL